MPTADLQAGLTQGRRPQRPLECHPAGSHAHRDLATVRQPQPDRFCAGRKPPLQRLGQFLLQRLHDLMPERVSVVELHDTAPRPAPVGRGAGIALHRDHLMSPARQASSDIQTGRTGTDNGYPHDGHPLIRYTIDVMTASIVHLICRDVKTRGAR